MGTHRFATKALTKDVPVHARRYRAYLEKWRQAPDRELRPEDLLFLGMAGTKDWVDATLAKRLKEYVPKIDFDGERLLTVGHMSFTMPIPIYRGVFARGRFYAQHDMVTHSGSVWIATALTDDVPGDGATHWKLAVKRGPRGRSPGQPVVYGDSE